MSNQTKKNANDYNRERSGTRHKSTHLIEVKHFKFPSLNVIHVFRQPMLVYRFLHRLDALQIFFEGCTNWLDGTGDKRWPNAVS